jgi:N-acetylglucosaminyl-diphospho-decaprenol L-rhamnosyltransferase
MTRNMSTFPAAASSPKMAKTVVIAIVGFKNLDDILNCLQALGRLTFQDFVVHICENGGAAAYGALIAALDGIATAEATAPVIRDPGLTKTWRGRLAGTGQAIEVYHSATNSGYAGGVNACLRQIPPEFEWGALWILNPDAVPEPGALQAMADHAAKDPSYGIIGSRVILRESRRVQLYGGRWRPMLARGFNIGLHAEADALPDVAAVEAEMTYVYGASMYVTRAFYEAVGLMDERYFLYNEEVDWCFRRGRFRLGYAHGSIVYHAHGSTIGSSVNRRQRSRLSVYLDERNKLLFTKRFFPVRFTAIAAVTLLLTTQYLKQGAVKNFGNALDGWLAGIRGEEGLPHWMRG